MPSHGIGRASVVREDMNLWRLPWLCVAFGAAYASATLLGATAPPIGGSISGTIALDDRGSYFPPAMGVRISVRRDDDRAARTIGAVRIGDVVVAKDGTRAIAYTVTELPLGTRLDVTADPVPPRGAAPIPRDALAELARFRPKGEHEGGAFLGEAYMVKLTVANPAVAHRDFAVYMLEAVPPAQPSR
jgi:hypothetical protein